jgi:hypothetical protein
MKQRNLLSAALVAVAMLSVQTPVFGQTTDTTTTTTTKVRVPAHTDVKTTTTTHKTRKVRAHKESAEEIQLREMRESLKAQQDQINALQSQVAAKSADATAAQQTAADAQAQASAAAASAAQAQAAAAASSSKVDAVSSSVSDLKTTTAGLTDTVVTGQKKIEDEINEPAKLHYKGLTITPVAFFAAEGVWRQHSVNSDINTPLNSIPFPSASEGHVSELNFSARQSRIGGLFEGDAGTYKLSGYFESDFLGTGTSSNNNQSNSYVLRVRQIWGKAENAAGFAVTGGQLWSLVTENRRGTDVRTEILPQTIDPQYMVGYSWTRQPGFRIQQRFGDYKTGAFTAALSIEQAQITNFTAAGTLPNEYFFGGLGQNGGLYNAATSGASTTTTTCSTPTATATCVTAVSTSNLTTYANNVVPDLLVKAAVDYPAFHFEVGGIARFFRDYYIPVATYGTNASGPTYTYVTTGYQTHTSTGGGVFGSARVYFQKFAEFAVQGMAGQGVGRYGSSQLADATLRPDETLEPIRNYHGLASLEMHLSPKFDVYAYYGGEYAQRTVYTAPAGNLIGYGPRNLSDTGCYNASAAPSTTVGTGVGGGLGATGCSSPTRFIQEGMFGITYKAINSPKYGRLQYQATFSRIQRNLWSGVGSATTPSGPRAEDPMIHVSMRYYIP